MMKKVMGLLAGTLFTFGAHANAATITSLYDSFETESGPLSGVGYIRNFNGFKNWDVTDGTVDLKKVPNTWGITCSNGSFCVDLDGSSGDAGVFTTKDGFATGSYKVSFDLSGNQRDRADDSLTVLFGAGSLLTNLVLSSGAPWKTYSFVVSLNEGDKLSFTNFGGDKVGIMLDNVSVSAVPVPAAAFLFAPALLGFMGLRRKAAKV